MPGTGYETSEGSISVSTIAIEGTLHVAASCEGEGQRERMRRRGRRERRSRTRSRRRRGRKKPTAKINK